MHKIPTVLAPHGSLEKWALKKSWWKKQIALRLYEGRNLRNANCLHACSEQEVAGIRDYGLKNAIAVIPNGISDSWLSSSGSGDEFREQFKLPKEKRIMLFLSRITPIKGLPMLIEALNLIRQYLDNWLLVIAGSDEFGHKARVVEKIEELKLEEYVRFTGLLTGQTKRNAFAASEFFILPSKREAAPVVILEALGSGIPVLATHGAPWEDLIRFRCGWWTEASVESISEAVKEGIGNSPEKLSAMGRRGKELVSTNYTWTKSAKMTIELYKWLLDRRDRPDFIILN
jgi:glycosyltransferase involved in cell wall biosynthesis